MEDPTESNSEVPETDEPEESDNTADDEPEDSSVNDADRSANQATTSSGEPYYAEKSLDGETQAETTNNNGESNMLMAIIAVEEEGLSKKDAAKKFHVSTAALKRRLKEIVDPKSSAGRPKFFSKRDERTLYSMLKSIHVLHVPFSKELFLTAAKELAEKKGYGEHSFGNSWLHGFIKRHPDLVLRKKTAKDKLAKWNKEKCDTFIEAMNYLSKEGYLADGRSVFSLDSLENVAPPPDKNKQKPVVPPSRKKPKNVSDKGYPVMVCGSASGTPLRTMFLREGNVILEPWFASTNQEVVVAQNLKGSFDTQSFATYVRHEVVPHIQSLDPPVSKSVIFIDDRWLASYDVDVAEIAAKTDLLIVPFPTGHNDKVQPMDRTKFRLVTRIWLEFVGERDRPLNEFVRTNTLARTLMASSRRNEICNDIKDGFQAKGLFPFEPAVIRSSVVSYGKPVLPLKLSSSVFDPFLKRFEGYTTHLGADCGIGEQYLKVALEAFRKSLISSGIALQPGSRHVEPVAAKTFHTGTPS